MMNMKLKQRLLLLGSLALGAVVPAQADRQPESQTANDASKAVNADSAPQATVTLSSLDWAPYIGRNIPGQGYVKRVVETAFNRAGHKLVIEFHPWARALKRAENGDVHGLFPEYYGTHRETDFLFSAPFPGGPVGFYKRKDRKISFAVSPTTNVEGALRSLAPFKFGVVRGYINTQTFDDADYLIKDMANSDAINLRKLYFGRVDLIFIDQYVAEHIMATQFPEYVGKLELMQPALEIKPLYIAFSRRAAGHAQRAVAFNQGLQQIREDGTLAKIMAEHGFELHDNQANGTQPSQSSPKRSKPVQPTAIKSGSANLAGLSEQ